MPLVKIDHLLAYPSPCSLHWSLIIICHPGHMWEVPSKNLLIIEDFTVFPSAALVMCWWQTMIRWFGIMLNMTCWFHCSNKRVVWWRCLHFASWLYGGLSWGSGQTYQEVGHLSLPCILKWGFITYFVVCIACASWSVSCPAVTWWLFWSHWQ